jgi:hypothetical protein
MEMEREVGQGTREKMSKYRGSINTLRRRRGKVLHGSFKRRAYVRRRLAVVSGEVRAGGIHHIGGLAATRGSLDVGGVWTAQRGNTAWWERKKSRSRGSKGEGNGLRRRTHQEETVLRTRARWVQRESVGKAMAGNAKTVGLLHGVVNLGSGDGDTCQRNGEMIPRQA